MELVGRGVRVRVYFGERDHHHGTTLWSAMLDYLRANHAAGATVTRALAGYGAHSRLHAATLVDLSSDLPLVLEWVDTEERVGQLLPGLSAMLDGGLLTTDTVEIRWYKAHDLDRGPRSTDR
jgi:PII-like signaling protein